METSNATLSSAGGAAFVNAETNTIYWRDQDAAAKRTLAWIEKLNLSRLTLSYHIGAFYSRLALGTFDFVSFLVIAIHFAVGIIATCKLFQKQELDF